MLAAIALGLCACVVLLLIVEVWHLHRVVNAMRRAVRGLSVESVRRPTTQHDHVWDADAVAVEHVAGKPYGIYRCLTCPEHGRFELGKQPR